MTRLVPFLGRKPTSAAVASAISQQQPGVAGSPDEMELDSDLFAPIATQLGQENEAIRNLLMDAQHKIGELEIVKRSIGSLVGPVVKALQDYEEVKNEKLHIQSKLNTTRVSHSKLRDDLTAAEKKVATLDNECNRLREMTAATQQSMAALERTKSEQNSEVNSRRAQIAELQRQLQQQSSELQTTRDENRRLAERFAAADKRMVQLEGSTQTALQKAMQANNERVAVQAALDKALNDYSLAARKVTEVDKALTASQARLKAMEGTLAEAQAERTRLSAALDEANHKHLEETSQQSARFEALQARSGLTEKLLEEARQALLARADEIRTLERRVIESSDAHGTAGEKLSLTASALAELELRIKDHEQSHAAMNEQNQTLISAVASREAAYNRTQQKIKEQEELVALLESQLKSTRGEAAAQIEQLGAQIQRERIERAMAEGALESGRKDIARLMRELSALQHRPGTAPAPQAIPVEIPGKPDRLKTAA